MNDLVINNNTDYNIVEITSLLVETILNKLELDNVSMSVNIISNEEMLEINQQYRNKASVTDVITFSYEDEDNFNEFFEVRELGDIFIAIDYVYTNSKKIGHSMSREYCFVLAHGILHTLGYNHLNEEEEAEMFSLQETLINEIILKGSELDEIFS